MPNISENWGIGIDISEQDESVMVVGKIIGDTFEETNIIFGKEAEDLYERLTGNKIKVDRVKHLVIKKINNK